MHRRTFLASASLAAAPGLARAAGAGQARAAAGARPGFVTVPLVDGGLADTAAAGSENILIEPMGEDNLQYLGQAAPGSFRRITTSRPIGVLFGFDEDGGGPALEGDPSALAAGNGAYTLTPRDVLELVALDRVNRAGRRVWRLAAASRSPVSEMLRPGGDLHAGAPDTLKFIGTPGPDAPQRYWPFMVDGAAGKAFTGGLFLRDWGDTPEIGFDVGDKDEHGRPIPFGTRTELPYPGGYIYSRAGIPDGRGGLTFVDAEAYAKAGASPPYLYIGRPCQLEFPLTETPSQTGTGGGFTVCVTRHGTVSPIQRSWWSHAGNLVAAGKATFEAAGIPYPFDVKSLSWWRDDRRQAEKWTAPSGDCNYFETPGWGNVSIVMTDIASPALEHNAGLAMRCYGAHGTGVDFGYDFGQRRWAAYRVHQDARTPVISVAPETGALVLGHEPDATHAVLGRVTTPHNPAFQAALGRDLVGATGDGTPAFLTFDDELYDRGGDFDPRAGAFTAPVEGLYQLQATLQFGDFGVRDEVRVEIVTDSRAHRLATGVPAADRRGRAGVSLSATAAMKAGERARVRLTVGGGARDLRLLAPDTVFSGFLVG